MEPETARSPSPLYNESNCQVTHSLSGEADQGGGEEGKSASGEGREVRFNVILLGDNGVGKTSFLQAFSDIASGSPPTKRPPRTPLLPSSQSLQPVQFLVELPKERLQLTVIDTPGYGQFESFLTWQVMIETYITEQAVSFYHPDPDSPPDPRIHLCLYFLEGARVKETDLKMLFFLQKTVPIIPILAKSETLTPVEVLAAKLHVIETCAYAGIRLLDATALPEPWTERLNSAELGPCPPFALISYCERIKLQEGRETWGRKYRWGLCEVENPAHSDFSLLCEALLHALPGHCATLSAEMGRSLAAKYEKKLRKLREKTQSSGPGVQKWAMKAIRGVLWFFGR